VIMNANRSNRRENNPNYPTYLIQTRLGGILYLSAGVCLPLLELTMSLWNDRIPDVVIPNGANVSQVVSSLAFNDADGIMLYGLLTTDGVITYTLEVNPDAKATNASAGWATLQIGDPAGDAVPPLQGKARFYSELAAPMAFRIKASANVTADRTWNASKNAFI
jgi:hypothetical protein